MLGFTSAGAIDMGFGTVGTATFDLSAKLKTYGGERLGRTKDGKLLLAGLGVEAPSGANSRAFVIKIDLRRGSKIRVTVSALRATKGMRPRSCLLLAAAAAAAAAFTISSTARAETCSAEPASVPSSVTTGDFAARLRDRIDACATDARRDAATRFCDAHGLDCTETVTRDYVRLWTLFELTRDGGPFRVRWAITNQDPTSRNVWRTWRQSPPALASTAPSAVAECDEISALFANLARKMGTRNVGLYWPTWNHTIAAWQPTPAVRVLVPTTQIFLACDDGFDHTSFSLRAQKTVFEFSAGDVPDNMTLPGALAAFLLDQTTHYAGASVEVLAAIRAHRAIRFGSSVAPACGPELADRARARAIGAGDRRALVRYAAELGVPGATAEEVLAKL